MIAAGAGIGGGGLLVPIFILVSGFEAKYAIPLSNVTILGSAVSNIMWNSQRRHPTADRYLIDWGIVNVMEPMTMAGAIFGSLLNKLLPQWITISLLALVLGGVSVKTYNSGMARWEKETELPSQAQAATSSLDGGDGGHGEIPPTIPTPEKPMGSHLDVDPLHHTAGHAWVSHSHPERAGEMAVPDTLYGQSCQSAEVASAAVIDERTALMDSLPITTYQSTPLSDKLEISRGEEAYNGVELDPLDAAFEAHSAKQSSWHSLAQEVREEGETTGLIDTLAANRQEIAAIIERERHVPWDMMAALLLTFCGCTGLDLARGGNGFNPMGVECGSELYWILTFAYVPFTAAIAAVIGCRLVAETARKEEIGYPFQEGDVRWTLGSATLYSVICSASGVMAGLFGVGGGIVKAPLMNEMGVLPQAIQATAGFMIFFTAGTATMSYDLYGMVLWRFGLVLLPIGFVFNQIGQIVVFHFVERYSRPSLVIFVIAGILGLSTVFMTYNGVQEIIATTTCDCPVKYDVCD